LSPHERRKVKILIKLINLNVKKLLE
jgi:hypothetical protein